MRQAEDAAREEGAMPVNRIRGRARARWRPLDHAVPEAKPVHVRNHERKVARQRTVRQRQLSQARVLVGVDDTR